MRTLLLDLFDFNALDKGNVSLTSKIVIGSLSQSGQSRKSLFCRHIIFTEIKFKKYRQVCHVSGI